MSVPKIDRCDAAPGGKPCKNKATKTTHRNMPLACFPVMVVVKLCDECDRKYPQ